MKRKRLQGNTSVHKAENKKIEAGHERQGGRAALPRRRNLGKAAALPYQN